MKRRGFSQARPGSLAWLWPLFLLGPLFTAIAGWPGTGARLSGWRPDMALLLSLFLALRAEPWLAYAGAFWFGLFEGYLTLAPPGLYSINLMAGVLIARTCAAKLEIRGCVSLGLLALALALLLSIGLTPWLLNIAKANPRHPFLSEETLFLSIRACLTTAVCAGPAFRLLDPLFHPKDVP